jgi:hypothetical protein
MSYSRTTYKLARRNGRWYVRYTMCAFLTPEMVSNYWPISMDLSDFDPGANDADGADLMEGSRPGAPFTFAQHGFRRYVVLMNGGQTECAPGMAESVPIPPPVQRGRKLEVRWDAGRWIKLTAKGWRDA